MTIITKTNLKLNTTQNDVINDTPICMLDYVRRIGIYFKGTKLKKERNKNGNVLDHSYNTYYRYLFAVMGLLGIAIGVAVRSSITLAIVAMTNNKTVWVNASHFTVISAEFDWDRQLQGFVLTASYCGICLTRIPGGYIANFIGGRNVFGGGILGSAILSFFTPLVASWSVYLLILLRFVQGLSEGFVVTALLTTCSKWIPSEEKSCITSVIYSGYYVGMLFAMPVSAALVSSTFGWRSIFYVFGSMAVLWSLVWFTIITESPDDHSYISNTELHYIQQNRAIGNIQRNPIPWYDVLTSIPFWSLVTAATAVQWGQGTWSIELPTFINDVLHFKMQNIGLLSAVPHLLVIVTSISSGRISDMLVKYGVCVTTVRKLNISGGLFLQAIFTIVAGKTSNPTAVIMYLSVGLGFEGLTWGGAAVNYLDIAPQYAGILMGVSTTICTLTSIIGPPVMGTIVNNGGPDQWNIVLYISAVIYIIGGVIYAIFGSGKIQNWAEKV